MPTSPLDATPNVANPKMADSPMREPYWSAVLHELAHTVMASSVSSQHLSAALGARKGSC
jgi:hypothetical protein